MSHFYERMLFKEVHFSNEIIKLDKLLKEESHYFWETNTSETLYSYINKRHFRHLNLSYNFLSLSEYFRDALAEAEDDKEKYLFYCEAITTLIHQLIESNRRLDGHDLDWVNGQIKSIRRIISTNIGKLNLIEKEVKTPIGSVITIVPNNALLEETLNNVTDENIQNYLIEYSSLRNEGNITRKEEILKLLATKVEGITKTKKYSTKFKELCSNVDLLYNKLDLRHNIEVKDHRYYDKTSSNREKWLDLVYRQVLCLFNLNAYCNDAEKVAKLKREVENAVSSD